MNHTTAIVFSCLTALAVVVISTSIALLRRGRFYHWLAPDSRPRRWVLILLLAEFAIFLLWFPIWMAWPDALVSKTLLVIWAICWGIGLLVLKWFSGLIDLWIRRKGWPLR